LLAQMPAKSVIQDDIRSGNGRFQLVRKRGRSEVWNLFGQVGCDALFMVSTVFDSVLAMEDVLYTDTGGGTGNMTRHRCPIGLSYRSSAHGSSTETVEVGQQSSFESTVSGLQRISEQRPTLSFQSESSSSAQLISQTSGEVSIGDVDREVLIDSIVKCCALDLIDPEIFNGKGFRALLDRMWQLSRRSGSSPNDVFPDSQMLQSALQTNLRFCMDDLKNELSRTSQGVCLAVESLSYLGKEFRVVHGSRISHDWKWRSNILGVFKSRESQSLAEIVNGIVNNYDLERNLLRITCAGGIEEFAPAKAFHDIREKLREVLHAVLSSCSVPVLPLIAMVDKIVKSFADYNIRMPFPCRCSGDDIFNFYPLLRDFNFHHQTIQDMAHSKCALKYLVYYVNKTLGFQMLLASLNVEHLRELEEFLGPFQETYESLSEEQPNFHKVLPEWYALMHECHPSSDETSSLLCELKTKASELLIREQATTITVEHRIAAILNPRHNRKLNLICTDHERSQACDRIRALCGIRTQREPLSRDGSCEGEPHRKRRLFLSSLEDDPVGDDELECYLRSQYPAQQTKGLPWCRTAVYSGGGGGGLVTPAGSPKLRRSPAFPSGCLAKSKPIPGSTTVLVSKSHGGKSPSDQQGLRLPVVVKTWGRLWPS
uniref:Protein kinase domain-containing protein n=1 Tax=Angiostrongylus cantonensis TaxID=6313 RepID=A0A158PBV1_ANGCA